MQQTPHRQSRRERAGCDAAMPAVKVFDQSPQSPPPCWMSRVRRVAEAPRDLGRGGPRQLEQLRDALRRRLRELDSRYTYALSVLGEHRHRDALDAVELLLPIYRLALQTDRRQLNAQLVNISDGVVRKPRQRDRSEDGVATLLRLVRQQYLAGGGAVQFRDALCDWRADLDRPRADQIDQDDLADAAQHFELD